MVEPIVTAVITGFISALGTFLAINHRVDRLDEKFERRFVVFEEKFDRKFEVFDEKFDRRFDALMFELLRHIRDGHPPNPAA